MCRVLAKCQRSGYVCVDSEGGSAEEETKTRWGGAWGALGQTLPEGWGWASQNFKRQPALAPWPGGSPGTLVLFLVSAPQRGPPKGRAVMAGSWGTTLNEPVSKLGREEGSVPPNLPVLCTGTTPLLQEILFYFFPQCTDVGKLYFRIAWWAVGTKMV